MTEHLSILIAFGAGLLSFLSPCVLPLIPSYLCIIGGTSLSGAVDTNSEIKPHLVARTASFILGFSAVFIILSILLAATFSLMGGISRWINWISGAVVIILGLNIIFDFLSFLNYEKRFLFASAPRSIAEAFLAGAAFGGGWTPCVGPVLGSILLIAAQSGGIPQAAIYLVFYSAGLGIPFLLAAIFFNGFVKTSAKLRDHLPLIRRISGVLLVIIGILIITGRYQELNALTAKWQNSFTSKKQNSSAAGNGVVNVTNSARGEASEDKAVSREVISAFNNAGLPVTEKGFDSIELNLPLLSGGTQRLSDLMGQVVFLNFWATWCGPCRIEMPSMEALYQRPKNQGFTIAAVNLAEDMQTVSAFIRRSNFTFPVLLDEKGSTGIQYGIQAIPTTYILDQRGIIISRITGSIDWNKPEVIAAFETLLANEGRAD